MAAIEKIIGRPVMAANRLWRGLPVCRRSKKQGNFTGRYVVQCTTGGSRPGAAIRPTEN